ncbi:MAG: acyl-CoA synthetase [Burkholderiaceae bacterium]
MALQHHDWIAHHARHAPNDPAQTDLYSGRSFTYAQMNARVDALARWLQESAGVKPGERIATLCHNSTDCNEIMFAAARVGAIHLPINWRLAVPELEFILKDAEPRVLFFSEEFTTQAGELNQRCPLPHLVLKREGEDSDYERIMAQGGSPARPHVAQLCDPWIILYTSGTTGRPKGALITYEAQLFNAINATCKTELTRRSVGLTYLPQFHVGGICLYASPCFHLGAPVQVMRQFDPQQALDLLANPASGITHVFGVPTNFLFMSQLPGFEQARFDHLVSAGVGGAAAPIALLERFAEKGLLFQQGWGMTETASIGTLLSKERALEKIGSSGQGVLHVQLRVIDDHGKDLPAGQTGELLIKGPTVTPGYWKRPEATAASLQDGWLRTGDAAYIDPEGYVYIVDRWKDMYISGGENVYPAEVEDTLYRLGGIAECAVIGIPDEKWGEVGRAFIVLEAGASLNADDVLEHCARNLARYKIPRTVRFVTELPHNATGKVTKHALPRD